MDWLWREHLEIFKYICHEICKFIIILFINLNEKRVKRECNLWRGEEENRENIIQESKKKN